MCSVGHELGTCTVCVTSLLANVALTATCTGLVACRVSFRVAAYYNPYGFALLPSRLTCMAGLERLV